MAYYVEGTNLSAAHCAEPGASHDRLSALLARVAAGEGAGMAALYDETSPLIFGLLTRMLGAGTLAEETLVEVYSCVARNAASYNPANGSPITWLVTTARECALRKELPDHPHASTPEASKAPTHDETAPAPEVLGGLAPKQREALQLAYFYGLRQTESAFNLSTEQARSLVTGALRSYAEVLETLGSR